MTDPSDQRAFSSLELIQEPVDIVDVFRRAEYTPAVALSAVTIGAKVLWLQQGIVNDEAAATARLAGLVVIMDRCLGVTVRKFGIVRE